MNGLLEWLKSDNVRNICFIVGIIGLVIMALISVSTRNVEEKDRKGSIKARLIRGVISSFSIFFL